MRSTPAALAAVLLLAAPAAAQVCDCAPGAVVEDGPATLVMPYTLDAPRLRHARRTVLVPHVVFVPRRRFLPGTVAGPLVVYPAAGAGYPGHWHYGATYVPPGAAYGCTLGAVGCDSSFVGPLGQFDGE